MYDLLEDTFDDVMLVNAPFTELIDRKPVTIVGVYYYISIDDQFDIEISCTQTAEDNTVVYVNLIKSNI